MNEDDATVVPAGVREALCSDPEIEFVVAFGSRVEDTARSSSDLDIAVKFADDLGAEERFRKRCLFAGHLQRSDVPTVDISDIEELPLELAHEAVSGDFVCGDETAFRTFRTTIESEFADRRDDIEQRQRDRIHRIANDGLHG